MATTNIKYTIQVNVPVANVYRDDTKNADAIVATTYQGYELIATKVSDDRLFYYIPAYEGWIQLSNFTITNVNTDPSVSDVFIKGTTKTTDASKEFAGKDNIVINTADPTTMTAASIANSIVPTSYNSSGTFSIGNADSTSGIFGIPYQFMPNVDRRFKAPNRNGVGDGIGRKFGEKILARDNLIYLQPGESQFMPGCTDEEKESVLGALVEGGGGVDVLKSNARYYSFKLDYDDYFKYVNTACHGVANLMGISDERITVNGHTSTVGTYSWQNALGENTLANNLFGTNKNLVFYMDGYNQVSEDYGNSTRESSLVSTVNGYSDTVKEINYIMGYTGANSDFFNDVSEGYEETFSSIQQGISEFGSGKGVLHALLGNASTILSGGKLVFPEMWSDSDYDRTYNIEVKLRSPEADELSIYLNIIVPYIHLVALTAPRDFDINGNGNGYKAPFLVRAFVKSMFNIDLGIITSLSVTKGGEANWSASTNLPTAIDVSLSIKDLYKSMYISNGDSATRLVANDSEMEQLMTIAGVDYRELNALDKASLAASIFGGNVYGTPARLKTRITDELNNALRPLYTARFR